VLYSVRRCILEYLGLEVMEPFVAYAAPRVEAAVRAEYLRGWEARLSAAASDRQWQERLDALPATAIRAPVEKKAWAIRR
jgi:NAD(P)H dehydrogenase (quinone)